MAIGHGLKTDFPAFSSICDLRVMTQGEIQTHQLWMVEYLRKFESKKFLNACAKTVECQM